MKYLISFLLLLSTFSPTLLALTTDVTVDRIRYCRTIWPICNDAALGEYHWWEDNGVPDQIQKNTYIGRYNEPAYANVEHLVLLSAGQRFDDGHHNLITGQPEFQPYSKQKAHHTFSISPDSIAYKLFDRGIYHEENTFVALAFDARFNWGFSNSNKNDIVDAYFAWLKSKVSASRLKSVYLAGHSRGGALVMRLAQKFQAEMPNVLVIVHAFDPVPNRSKGELGAYNSSINNPVMDDPRDTGGLNNKGFWSWKSDFDNQYPNKTRLSIYNFLNGGKIDKYGVTQEVRSVSHKDGSEVTLDLGWYFQRWYSGNHGGIAVTEWLMDRALDHVVDRLNFFSVTTTPEPVYRFDVSCSASPDRGAGPVFASNLSAQAFTDDPTDSIASYEWTFGPSSYGNVATGAGPHERAFFQENGNRVINNSVKVTTTKGKVRTAYCPVQFL